MRGQRGKILVLLGAFLMGAAGAFPQDTQKKRALVIGLNTSYANVEGVGKLKFAEADALEVAAVLERQGWEKPVPLLGPNAPRPAILNALVALARDSSPEDTVLIYFAGHGVSARQGRRSHTYWVVSDTTLGRLETDGLRLEHLMDYVDDIPARKKVVILDHCHSGTVQLPRGGGGGGGRDGGGTLTLTRDLSLPDELPGQLKERVGEGLLVVGAATDAAYELARLEHGLVTHLLLKALSTDVADKPPAGNGDGRLSTTELADYLEKETGPLAVANSVKQQPIVVVGGNLRAFDITTLPQTPDRDEAVLLATIGHLAANGLDQRTEQVCTLAVQAWADARRRQVPPNDRDQLIVRRLQAIQDQGAGASWTTEARKLPGFIGGLP